MKVLFLSDIHFGRQLYCRGNFANREKIQQQLIETLCNLPDEMRPNYVVVTGDVAWTGHPSEFMEAEEWFKRLLDALGLTSKHITFCVGNHDVDRRAGTDIPYEALLNDGKLSYDAIDALYEYRNLYHFHPKVQAYNDFCNGLGVIPYHFDIDITASKKEKVLGTNRRYSYSNGIKDVKEADTIFRFVCFNTALLSGFTDHPDDENFLGLPQIQQLKEQGLIGCNHQSIYTIALFHHAERYLNTVELNSYNSRPATLPSLLNDVNLALCGHTESGAVPIQRMQEAGGILLNGGATYYSDDHPNSFSILNIDSGTRKIDICAFSYKQERWQIVTEIDLTAWNSGTNKIRFLDDLPKIQPCFLEIEAGSSKKVLPINMLQDALYIKGNSVFLARSNDLDLCRKISIQGDENGLHIGIPDERVRDSKCMADFLEMKKFVFENTNAGESAMAKLRTITGAVLQVGEFPRPEWEADGDHLLTAVHLISTVEDKYGVRLFIPDRVEGAEEFSLHLLIDLSENRAAGWKGEIPFGMSLCAYVKEHFDVILEKVMRSPDKMIAIKYRAPMMAKVFGSVISLGTCTIVAHGLRIADIGRELRKRDTFELGDTRRIHLIWPNNEVEVMILGDDYTSNEEATQAYNQYVLERNIVFSLPAQGIVWNFGNVILVPDYNKAAGQDIQIREDLSFVDLEKMAEFYGQR